MKPFGGYIGPEPMRCIVRGAHNWSLAHSTEHIDDVGVMFTPDGFVD